MLKRILVIDDNQSILQLMQIALGDEGFGVFIYNDTEDILSLIQQCQPDLLILDYFLNGKNGGEMCRQVKNSKLTANLPVVLFSAYPDILEFMGGYGCDAFLAKPFDLTQMTTIVRELINSSTYQKLIPETKPNDKIEHIS